MSRDGKGDAGRGGKKDLRLVKPSERVEPEALDRATDAVRHALAPEELNTLDNEALLALTLGEDVSDIDVVEQERAARLGAALDGEGVAEDVRSLAELAVCLRAAHAVGAERGDTLAAADNEALLALTIDADAARLDAQEEDAAALCAALEGRGAHPLADLATALKMTHACPPLETADSDALIALTVSESLLEDTTVSPNAHAALTKMLQATAGMRTLAASDGDTLVAVSLGVEAIASESERGASTAFADAMSNAGEHPLMRTTEMLRAAAGPDLDQLSHERILKRALDQAIDEVRHDLTPVGTADASNDEGSAHRGKRVALVGAIVALAAGFALFFGSMRWLETQRGTGHVAAIPKAVDGELVMTRSTMGLFDPLEKFPTRGGESERVGKIVSSRAADLRRNRFLRWGAGEGQ